MIGHPSVHKHVAGAENGVSSMSSSIVYKFEDTINALPTTTNTERLNMKDKARDRLNLQSRCTIIAGPMSWSWAGLA